MRRTLTVLVLVVVAMPLAAQRAVEVLDPHAAVAAHVVGGFTQPVVYAHTSDGRTLVLDRREHTVFLVAADGQTARQIIGIGNEPGRLLRPITMALAPNDTFAVLDLPGANQRVQFFTLDGRLAGGFLLPVMGSETIVDGAAVPSGTSAIAFDGSLIWLNVPAWGALVTGMDMTGQAARYVGMLRRTGQEDRPDLHHALNTGFPIVAADGTVVFVFQSGVPLLRRYTAEGTLEYERHIEGPELDPIVQALPDIWPESADGTRPLPEPIVRTAAVDADGRTWIALETGHLYVYDRGGEKRRVFALGGAVSELPTSLAFTGAGRLLVGPGGYEFEVPATSAR